MEYTNKRYDVFFKEHSNFKNRIDSKLKKVKKFRKRKRDYGKIKRTLFLSGHFKTYEFLNKMLIFMYNKFRVIYMVLD